MQLNELVKPYIEKITKEESVSFSIDKLTGDASNREYFRIRFEKRESPDSLVLMKFNPENACKSDEAQSDSETKTFPFTDIQSYLRGGGIRVPKLYLSDAPRGLVFMEDLGDVQMFSLVRDTDIETRRLWYQRALDLLVKFQNFTANNPDTDSVAFGRNFDFELLRWECEHYLEWGVEAFYDIKIPDRERGAIGEIFDHICRDLQALPTVLVHRDFQSKNLMLHNDKITLIDFQDALLGPWPYDPVALLRDSYVDLDENLVEELIDYYLDRSREISGKAVDRAEFLRGFLLQTIQRKLKDAGRFVFIDRVKKNHSFLQYIPNSLKYVRWAFAKQPWLHELARLLGHYEERLIP